MPLMIFSQTMQLEMKILMTSALQREWMRTQQDQEGMLYDELEKIKPITASNGSVYLGSFISFSLCNDFDVKHHVTAATQAMGALKNIWNSPTLISGASTFSFLQFQWTYFYGVVRHGRYKKLCQINSTYFFTIIYDGSSGYQWHMFKTIALGMNMFARCSMISRE